MKRAIGNIEARINLPTKNGPIARPGLYVQKRSFKGVWIPREIWLNEELSITEKCLLTEIDSLDNENGCTAGNKYFADFFKVSTRQISKYVTRLEEKKLIKIEIIGRNRRRIMMEQKFRSDRTKVPSADRTKVPHSNTTYNNTIVTLPDKPADWNLTDKINEMKTDEKRKDLNIIGLWITEMGLKPENAQQLSSIISRNVRPAKLLAGYQLEDIRETILAMKNTEYLKKFTMETTLKFIDPIVANKKKEGPRIIKYEKIKKPDGREVMRAIYEK